MYNIYVDNLEVSRDDLDPAVRSQRSADPQWVLLGLGALGVTRFQRRTRSSPGAQMPLPGSRWRPHSCRSQPPGDHGGGSPLKTGGV